MGGDETKFDWDDANRNHLAQHDVSPEEVQEAVLDPHAMFPDEDIEVIGGEVRTPTVGMTASGKVLLIVFAVRGEAIRPITARAAPAHVEARHLKRRGL